MHPYLPKNSLRNYSTPTPRVLAKCWEKLYWLLIILYKTLTANIYNLKLDSWSIAICYKLDLKTKTTIFTRYFKRKPDFRKIFCWRHLLVRFELLLTASLPESTSSLTGIMINNLESNDSTWILSAPFLSINIHAKFWRQQIVKILKVECTNIWFQSVCYAV
jgi:hypothetical protein